VREVVETAETRWCWLPPRHPAWELARRCPGKPVVRAAASPCRTDAQVTAPASRLTEPVPVLAIEDLLTMFVEAILEDLAAHPTPDDADLRGDLPVTLSTTTRTGT
jgi:hypothetical protein